MPGLPPTQVKQKNSFVWLIAVITVVLLMVAVEVSNVVRISRPRQHYEDPVTVNYEGKNVPVVVDEYLENKLDYSFSYAGVSPRERVETTEKKFVFRQAITIYIYPPESKSFILVVDFVYDHQKVLNATPSEPIFGE